MLRARAGARFDPCGVRRAVRCSGVQVACSGEQRGAGWWPGRWAGEIGRAARARPSPQAITTHNTYNTKRGSDCIGWGTNRLQCGRGWARVGCDGNTKHNTDSPATGRGMEHCPSGDGVGGMERRGSPGWMGGLGDRADLGERPRPATPGVAGGNPATGRGVEHSPPGGELGYMAGRGCPGWVGGVGSGDGMGGGK
jgi:hypothetical protein